MQAMCLNCKFYDGVEPPYCEKRQCATHPALCCTDWQTNQKPAARGEEVGNG